MKPYVVCHMITSLDGGLHPSRWSESPDGSRNEWTEVYQKVHERLDGDAWIVGRVTMAEMTEAGPHGTAGTHNIDRPYHVAARDARSFAIALDPAGKLHFDRPDIDGDHLLMLLGHAVSDSHLAELAADGISYIVAENPEIDLATMLDLLGRVFGVKRLLLEGGAGINRAFFEAGLVDELSLLVAPALDGRSESPAWISPDPVGLCGKLALSLSACQALDHGVVHLRYAVASSPKRS